MSIVSGRHPGSDRGRKWAARLALLGGCGVGVCVVVKPLLGLGAIAFGGGAVLLALHVRDRSRIFLSVLGLLLVGYALMGRGFAYLGPAPVYVGELVLGVGLLVLGVRGGVGVVPLWGLVSTLAFMAWGAVGVVAALPRYGLDALRDGVIWEYAAFALLCAAGVLHTRCTGAAIRVYAKLIPFLLCWLPVAVILSRVPPSWLPVAPGTQIPIVSVWGGDAAVHWVGIAVFWLLGVGRGQVGAGQVGWLTEWVRWVPWAVGCFVLTSGRAGLLTIIVPVALVVLLGQRVRWMKGAAVLVFITVCLVVGRVSIHPGGEDRGREISPRQVVLNLKSVFGSPEREELENTREWRLNWWTDIVRYTFAGKYFWLGKGFGINLASDDGYQVMGDESLRSPHNGHLTVLARMGVPGLLLWTILQGMFAIRCLSAYIRARRIRQDWQANLDLWLLSYWLAFMINSTFGVALESPQGGIWFWSLIGFAMAELGMQAHDMTYARVTQESVSPVIG